ncbi:MAG: hypothetical protein ACPL5F_05470 [Moorellaceae bacterium]
MRNLEQLLQQLPEAADNTLFAGWEMDERHVKTILARLERSNRKPSRQLYPLLAAAVMLAALALVLTASIPVARAALQQVLAEAALWVKARTGIPIYLPQGWPLPNKETGTGGPTINYYFEVFSNMEGYNINIYTVEEPVPLNQVAQLKTPLSESQYVGSISGKLRKNAPALPVWDQAKSKKATRLELPGGVIAYNLDQVEVFWEKGGWRYWVLGHDAPDYAEKLAAAVGGTGQVPKAEGGCVRIVAGNAVTVYVAWNLGEYQYELVYRGEDIARALDIAYSATQWIETNMPPPD